MPAPSVNRRRVLQGRSTIVPALFPLNNLFGVFGDSRTQITTGDLPNTRTINAAGYGAWALQSSGYRAALANGSNFGVGGDTTTQMVARLSQVTASPAQVIVFLGGVNDNDDSALSLTNYVTILDALHQAGKIVVLCNELPFSSPLLTPAALLSKQAAQLVRRDWLENPARRSQWPNIVQVDTFRPCLKEGTACDFKDGYAPYVDIADPGGLHPQVLGNSVIGAVIGNAMASLYASYPRYDNAPTSAGDVYNASTNQTGVVSPNFMMTGTTGGLGTPAATGQVATSWNMTTTSAGGATITCSKAIDSDGFDQQVIRVTGTPTSGGRSVSIAAFTNNATFLNYLSGGDRVYTVARVSIDAGAIGFRAFGIGAQVNGTYGGVSSNITAYNFASTSFEFAGVPFNGIACSQLVDVNAGWATGTSRGISPIFNIGFTGGAPVDFTVRISRAGMRKYIPPLFVNGALQATGILRSNSILGVQ